MEKKAAFLTGMITFSYQSLIMRELYLFYDQNEVVFSLLLAIWMIFAAAGAIAARKIKLPLSKIPVLLLLSIFSFSALYTIQYTDTAAVQNIGNLLLWSWVLFLPASYTGFILSLLQEQNISQAADIYAAEIAGCIFGSAIVWFFIPIIHSFFILCLLSLLLYQKKNLFSFLIISTAGIFCFFYYSPEKLFLKNHPGSVIIDYSYGSEGTAILSENSGQNTLYMNNTPIISWPDADSAAESILYSYATDTKSVLILGIPPPDIVKKIAGYYTVPIHIVSPDSAAVKIMKNKYTSPDVHISCSSYEAALISGNTYTLILSFIPTPASFSQKKYISPDFFRKIKHALAQYGIFAFYTEGNPYYMKNHTGIIVHNYYSLSQMFKYSITIPLDSHLLWITSESPVPDSLAGFLNRYRLRHPYSQDDESLYLLINDTDILKFREKLAAVASENLLAAVLCSWSERFFPYFIPLLFPVSLTLLSHIFLAVVVLTYAFKNKLIRGCISAFFSAFTCLLLEITVICLFGEYFHSVSRYLPLILGSLLLGIFSGTQKSLFIPFVSGLLLLTHSFLTPLYALIIIFSVFHIFGFFYAHIILCSTRYSRIYINLSDSLGAFSGALLSIAFLLPGTGIPVVFSLLLCCALFVLYSSRLP